MRTWVSPRGLEAIAISRTFFLAIYLPVPSHGSTNPVPSVAITSPTNNAIYIYGPPIALQATASEQGGTITNVQFFNKTNLLGTAVVGANNTYAFAWTNAFEGSNALTAVATENSGLSVTSAPAVYVIMDGLPGPPVPIKPPIGLESGG